MNTSPKNAGERSEAIILAHLLRQGYAVSVPFGNNQRYDLILDDGEHLWKVQCKTGRFYQGCVVFAVSSKNGFTNERHAYHGEIDIFLVYCPHTDRIYKVPVEITGTNEMRLRVAALKPTAPQSTVRWAKDYEI